MRVDVVTAVHEAYAEFVVHAWRSLRAQSHPDWAWLVQIDGPPRRVLDALDRCGAAGDQRVRVHAHGTREGPAVTRNVALGRATAPLVQNLDADDELEPDALETLVAALRRHDTAGFAVGRARDLLPGGELVDHPLPVPAGLLPPGTVAQAWVTEAGRYRLP
ncbi:MAG: glycosyltransferase, partial [Thermocrispum sp.]